MGIKEDLYMDMETCEPSKYHIEEGITDPKLEEIDTLFRYADALSVENSKKHKDNLQAISIIIPCIAFFFLLYDEAEIHWMIIICLMLIIWLFCIYYPANQQDYHKKYLEYRVLAESIRVHYFLSISCVKTHVTEILPWFVKIGIIGLKDFLLELPEVKMDKKRSILDCWIKNQKTYHKQAWEMSKIQKKRNDRIENITLIITIIVFVITLIFEFAMIFYSPFNEVDANWIRAYLKIIVGTMSAITIFLGNYYGKMSLSSKIEEHRRMYLLYEDAENNITSPEGEETPELILNLAREFLTENTTWYAHQKKNKPDFTVES